MSKFGMVATWNMAFDGIVEQYEDLKNGKDINEALVKATVKVEDYPFFKSVGYGGLPNEEGKVQLDAGFMDGNTLQVGALASLEGFANPIKIAYKLKNYKHNSFLVGEGANKFALKEGFEQKDMLTDRANIIYQNKKKEMKENDILEAYSGHDTVCILGKDQSGKISSATSTSGLFMKKDGRVGDSPITGGGFYAESEYGACAATGVGEDISKTVISYQVVRYIEDGLNAQEACDKALKISQAKMLKKYGSCGDISIVAIDHNATFGSATTLDEFSYVGYNQDKEPKVYLVTKEGDHTEASQEWIDNYYSTRHKEVVLD
ncbi:MAG: N(4)-(beta-N-acetylglucosaminyl)-L-asparaginase [Mycoplasmatales bacterium]